MLVFMLHRRVAVSLLLTIMASPSLGRLNVNVALNRPAFRSSVYSDPLYGDAFGPSKAVDGNKDPHALQTDNSCMHTNDGENDWWAVDLGLPLEVAGVLFTNRAETFGFRADNFIVGLTDVSPSVTAPTLWNYTLCAQYPGVVGDGATVYLQCTNNMPPRRYLIVQLESTVNTLNFCEIEVFLSRFDWKRKSGYRMHNRVVFSYRATRQIDCMNNCTVSPVCDSINLRESDNTCEFNEHATPLEANSADIVADNAWGWWSTSFTTVV